MLNNETRRRIDTARDILVGKVPDPKSQVEQITIALIYKFMDDMDKEAIEFGGKASFFTGEYEKYGWSKIFDPHLGGYEMLSLYGEAIEKLDQNPNIPQLFRDIFKNAYLPYRDPETLKLFLKTINEFTYDHSEKLGDAFEYLLSVLGSQGDAGQFRTPRHIIDFIVDILQPKKNETILDPACGTAGFLISSYKYILKTNTSSAQSLRSASISDQSAKSSNQVQSAVQTLTPAERKNLMNNFTGYDISPDMVRLSLVNMYLHHFTSPKIYEYDTLTSEDRWGDYFDIIMANPPFMTPKGGIKPHKKFTMQANRSEVLFVDYIAEHINPTTGRAGVIVPEGIIFQSATAYKALRKLLVDKNYLYAVVSLPAGIFQPYSGVKTSVLLMDKTIAKKTDKILFVKIENDGFDLGAQRKPIDKNDLPKALELIKNYQSKIQSGESFNQDESVVQTNYLWVEKEKIKANGDYNLSLDRYRVNENLRQAKYEMVEVSNAIEDVKYSNKIQKSEFLLQGKYPIIDQSENFIAGYWNNDADVFHITKPITVFGDHTRIFKYVDFDFVLGADGVKILQPKKTFNPKFFFYCLRNLEIKNLGYSRHYKELKEAQIPLPPLSIQQEIVNKIEGWQKIIDGAKQVVENYKPQIDINPDWEMVKLEQVCDEFQYGSSRKSNNTGDVVCIRMGNIQNGIIDWSDLKYAPEDEEFEKYLLKENDVLFNRTNSAIHVGKTGIFKGKRKAVFAGYLIRINYQKEKVLGDYLNYCLNTKEAKDFCNRVKTDGINQSNINAKSLSTFEIPLPPLSIQQQIVNQIEQEQQLINANKQLIKIFEQKIKDEINKLWQSEVSDTFKVSDTYTTDVPLSLVAEE